MIERIEMITGEGGGFIQRAMPPTDWYCGAIPTECYDSSLTTSEIEAILSPIYLAEESVKKLANSDDEQQLLMAKLSLEILVEIDAETIWCFNIGRG